MAVETIELSEGALCGVGPSSCSAMVDELPRMVKLGRIRSKALPSALNLASYFDQGAAAPLPPSINRRDKAAKALARMYLNDREGDCVIAGKAHLFAVLSANDGGEVIEATDAEIHSQYQSFCGRGDRGCNIPAVLDIIKAKGFVIGGKTYKIEGWARVDNTKKELVKATQYLFGATTIGIDLPKEWTSAAVWKPTNSQIVGGHDVTPIDYDDDGVYISSWGRIYLMTWEAFLSTKWITEYYAVMSELWWGADGLSPTGIDTATLREDFKKISSGVVPDIVDPAPPGPDLESYTMRLQAPLSKGKHGEIELGSDLAAGVYSVILEGDGDPPPVP